MELKCPVQTYAWGKLGMTSAVASLKSSSDPDFSVDQKSPYAELWMGTHPNGPAVIAGSGQTLKDLIAEDPEGILGQRCRSKFGDNLPYLFKVLSVNKALSIQTHPDKENAEKLHAAFPDIYKDPNHKPEMAIALTEFEGLCGFRPLSEIQGFLQSIPELSSVIGAAASKDLIKATQKDYADALKAAFTNLMEAPKDAVSSALSGLEARISSKSDKSSVEELFLRLLKQYPGDVGCLVIFFVNHVRLRPGQAMFLGPNLIHAYLSGDCAECMACSDNVVRAGLTPKLIDVPTLCSLVKYECAKGEDMEFSPTEEGEGVTLYNPPVPDFAVAKISVGVNGVTPPVRDSASISIVVEGGGSARVGEEETVLRKGTVLFVKANDTITFKSDEGMIVYQAFC